MTILSASLLLLLVLDPLGNVPFFLAVLQDVPENRRWKVMLRELLIALGVLGGFLVAGRPGLAVFGISTSSLRIAGGVVLFMISLKMIFGEQQVGSAERRPQDPLVVPLAVPAVAGPSAMATLVLLVSQEPHRMMEWAAALLIAWTASAAILMLGNLLSRLLGARGLLAIQRLMGMILVTLAVEMFLTGVSEFWTQRA
ncbi:MAG: MarC family protein [Planctomycetes bacterium]|jgi:multiple antibiotic resistance protein|nr:MarC family protein [Planctomycetota bacterium]